MQTSWRGEAPGRLDFMGGVADYSGSLVLETPIRERTKVTLTVTEQPVVTLVSPTEPTASIGLEELHPLFVQEPRRWGAALSERAVPHWARYVLGCLGLFAKHWDWWPEFGLIFSVESTVPTSMGVSSSAALEVATLRVLQAYTGKELQGTELAKMAQRAENEVVGAPCGLMDQLSSAHGQPGALLPILCRPDILSEPVRLPEGVTIVGWPSGVKHAVSDSPYATARAGAFMGKKMLEAAMFRNVQYLTEFSPLEVIPMQDTVLPEAMTGAEFMAQFGNVDDPLTTLEPDRVYPVRAATLFPVDENDRCSLAIELLQEMHDLIALEHSELTKAQHDRVIHLEKHVPEVLAELLYQSHEGYSAMGLGCPETDAMVDAVRERGPAAGFYGARVSGGGSGGTVVVLLEKTSLPALDALAKDWGTPPVIRAAE